MRAQLSPVTAAFACLLLGLASCGDNAASAPDASAGDGPAPQPMTALAIPSGAQLHLRLTTQVTIEEYDVHDEGHGDSARVSEPVQSAWWITPDGTLVEQRDEEGIQIENVVRGGAAWRRVGAVVADIPAAELPSLLASVEDLVCLIGWADAWPALERGSQADDDRIVFRGEGRPARHVFPDASTGHATRLESYATGGPAPINSNDALAILVVEETIAVEGVEGARLPAGLLRTVPGPGRTTTTRITVESAAVAAGDALQRPRRPETSKPVFGEPVRGRRRASNVVYSEHAGPMTDVPRLAAFVRRGLDTAKASASSALGLEIDRFPGDARPAAYRIVVPATLSRDRDAGDLPSGMMTRVDALQDVVTVPYRGALPASDAALSPALDAVREMGLEPDGTMRLLLPADLAGVDPSSLAIEIEVPVRERD